MTLSDTTVLGVAEHLVGESLPTLQNGAAAASPLIVLSLSEHGYPTQCLLRAHRLASSVGARLHVLRVLPWDRRCRAATEPAGVNRGYRGTDLGPFPAASSFVLSRETAG